MRSLLRVLLVLLLAPLPLARAQEFPTRPILMVVPWEPGSTGDLIVHILAKAIEPKIGQRLVLENRAGAGGNIGTAYVAHAKPDGYTLVVGPNNVFALNQFLYKTMGYDPLTDVIPITKILESPYVLYVNTQIPVKTLADLTSYSKLMPKPLFFASSGLGTSGHMGALLLQKLTGANIQVVPYGSSTQSVTALLQNEVQAYIASAAVGVKQVAAGNLHALAIAGPNRVAVYPDTPSAPEAGVPDFNVSNWWAVAAPRGTPPAIVDRLYQLIHDALISPDVSHQIISLGSTPGGAPPAETLDSIKKEAAYWGDITSKQHIPLQ